MEQSNAVPGASLGKWFFEHRDYTPVPFYVFMFLSPYYQAGDNRLLWPVGAVLLALGVFGRLWSIRYIGKRARTHKAGAERVISEGPFGHVRNPIYIANVLVHIGACFFLRFPWVAPLFLLVMAVQYHYIVKHEEQTLRELFGKPFDEYCRKVPRWLPRITSASNGEDAEEPYPWKEVFYREYQFVLGVAAGVAATFAKYWVVMKYLR